MANATIWIIATIVLVIISIVLAFLLGSLLINWVSPDNCPVIMGRYGVDAGMSGVPLNVCGDNNNELCEFNASTISNAIAICDRNDICKSFQYIPSDGKLIFIDPSSSTWKPSTSDIYVRQTT